MVGFDICSTDTHRSFFKSQDKPSRARPVIESLR